MHFFVSSTSSTPMLGSPQLARKDEARTLTSRTVQKCNSPEWVKRNKAEWMYGIRQNSWSDETDYGRKFSRWNAYWNSSSARRFLVIESRKTEHQLVATHRKEKKKMSKLLPGKRLWHYHSIRVVGHPMLIILDSLKKIGIDRGRTKI
jgi:hypothetical protein